MFRYVDVLCLSVCILKHTLTSSLSNGNYTPDTLIKTVSMFYIVIMRSHIGILLF